MNHKLPAWSELSKTVKIGLYEHYKGNSYRMLGIARHSETLEELVVYQALYGDEEIWIRPLSMFCERVKLDDQTEVPRFRYIGIKE